MNLLRGLFRKKRQDAQSVLTTCCDKVWIGARGAQPVFAHIHRPAASGRYHGVVIVPGGASAGTDHDGGNFTADDIAALGFIVLHYDPSGRGKTGGTEDFWGAQHQEELARVVEYFSKLPSVDADHIGILSFSIGIAIAAGALARFSMPVRYLFDWEGPSNRFNITKNDTHKPLKCFPTSNDSFWSGREPARFMPEVSCGYFRYQAECDHMQGEYKGHAVELLNLATRGKAAWTQCNDNPVGTFFEEKKSGNYHWVSSKLDRGTQISKYLLRIRDHGAVSRTGSDAGKERNE